MKKMIRVPVGKEPKIAKYYIGGSEYISYTGYGERLDPESHLKSIVSDTTELLGTYGDRYEDMSFDSVSDCGCRYDCSCRPSYLLMGKRLETDIEYNFRLEKETREKTEKENREKAEYEKLKAKFG